MAKTKRKSFAEATMSPATIAVISLFALLIRVLVSIGPHSGEASPPKYGDYEAQRHWMEITLHTPTSEWYRNTSSNDLSYWGLDYPPLSAYQSFAHGLIINSSLPSSLALLSSRGFESPTSKRMMRWTVISSDLMVFFPAAIWFVLVHYRRRNQEDGSAWWLLSMILLNPALILIDHGHFQYNCISLGLTLGAVAAVISDKDVIGAIMFTLAINHKQMSMYFAPAFFSYLLGKCLRRRNPILEVVKLGFVVLATFALVWWPYLYSLEAILAVLARLAPFERGIYEDYVANFWCSTSVIIKWKRLFAIQPLKILSFILTVSSFIPSLIHQIKSPSDHGFLYAMLNSSFSFYLFSYQVHEKSILLPLLPASLLAQQEPLFFGWLMYYALLSMYPLLCRDKLILQYMATLALFYLIYCSPVRRNATKGYKLSLPMKTLMALLLLSSFVLHLIYLIMKPPEKYPFLFEALIMSLCFSQFVMLTLYTNIKQWMLSDNSPQTMSKKNL
ncbi:Dolichyl-P-Glc:Man(9)GlcNAc(2)-PP-dolichol alpha-1,3-glucosyltransferase protein [Dioscorea alata]|uniref:Dolichyl-P-Glc:Man(9)GlcNAc(2)-PP-dolichol alpha-1,3-glucosyltransferase protein n=1 Tax=Dioscorea alata TaxID=55571 RepID=A0ACB7V2D2_DIOAL|nr:Dolichyl-P-Glc:Man(9)GlcNAc(2)-PP-dolichol alpha-1,3-glucosyltransferase protein [Dioscorea alata]